MSRTTSLAAYLQVAPLSLVFVGFLVFPILAIIVVSFWDYTEYSLVADFVLTNYRDVLWSRVTYTTYVNTLKFAVLTWLLTLAIGFTVAYFLAFHIRTFLWQMVLFLTCTVPFLTSNIIRMISWVPFLGRHGIFNATLQTFGLIEVPLEFLLFSDFAVVLAFVHLYTLFMVVPIFNSMMRIDRALLAAAADCGASGWQVMKEVVMPLSKPGMAIGSIFVVTLVMGDFWGAFQRSLLLGLMVMVLTVLLSLLAGLAFRKRFLGSTMIFYLAVASLIVPSILISLGIGLMFNILGWEPTWYSSALGAHLTWTLPFGLLIMFAVFNRFDKSYEEAARDLGASGWQTIVSVVLPIIIPSLIGIALFGFTLSYDEFGRTLLTAGVYNSLPLEIYGMTTNITSPALYALGTLTTGFSFGVIAIFLAISLDLRRRRRCQGVDLERRP